MRKKRVSDPIAFFQRQSTAARRVGPGKKCKCGEDRPLALISGSVPTICASCQRKKYGQSRYDGHHPAGQANHPATLPVWVNDHRARLTANQYEWPPETWSNPSGSPALAAAAAIRGYCETSEYLSESLLLENALFLEALEKFLSARLGQNWWRGTEVEPFVRQRKRRS